MPLGISVEWIGVGFKERMSMLRRAAEALVLLRSFTGRTWEGDAGPQSAQAQNEGSSRGPPGGGPQGSTGAESVGSGGGGESESHGAQADGAAHGATPVAPTPAPAPRPPAAPPLVLSAGAPPGTPTKEPVDWTQTVPFESPGYIEGAKVKVFNGDLPPCVGILGPKVTKDEWLVQLQMRDGSTPSVPKKRGPGGFTLIEIPRMPHISGSVQQEQRMNTEVPWSDVEMPSRFQEAVAGTTYLKSLCTHALSLESGRVWEQMKSLAVALAEEKKFKNMELKLWVQLFEDRLASVHLDADVQGPWREGEGPNWLQERFGKVQRLLVSANSNKKQKVTVKDVNLRSNALGPQVLERLYQNGDQSQVMRAHVASMRTSSPQQVAPMILSQLSEAIRQPDGSLATHGPLGHVDCGRLVRSEGDMGSTAAAHAPSMPALRVGVVQAAAAATYKETRMFTLRPENVGFRALPESDKGVFSEKCIISLFRTGRLAGLHFPSMIKQIVAMQPMAASFFLSDYVSDAAAQDFTCPLGAPDMFSAIDVLVTELLGPVWQAVSWEKGLQVGMYGCWFFFRSLFMTPLGRKPQVIQSFFVEHCAEFQNSMAMWNAGVTDELPMVCRVSDALRARIEKEKARADEAQYSDQVLRELLEERGFTPEKAKKVAEPPTPETTGANKDLWKFKRDPDYRWHQKAIERLTTGPDGHLTVNGEKLCIAGILSGEPICPYKMKTGKCKYNHDYPRWARKHQVSLETIKEEARDLKAARSGYHSGASSPGRSKSEESHGSRRRGKSPSASRDD